MTQLHLRSDLNGGMADFTFSRLPNCLPAEMEHVLKSTCAASGARHEPAPSSHRSENSSRPRDILFPTGESKRGIEAARQTVAFLQNQRNATLGGGPCGVHFPS